MGKIITAIGLSTLLFGASISAKTTTPATHGGTFGEVTLPEFKQLVDTKKAVIIDANGAEMYASGHVPGAISFAENEGKLANVLPADKSAPIVAYCGGVMCTAWEAAAKEAKQLGYTNIKHYKGGLSGWKKANYPTEKVKVTKS